MQQSDELAYQVRIANPNCDAAVFEPACSDQILESDAFPLMSYYHLQKVSARLATAIDFTASWDIAHRVEAIDLATGKMRNNSLPP